LQGAGEDQQAKVMGELQEGKGSSCAGEAGKKHCIA
jgi:hypothetical protein